jgi:hypothetical protein
MQCASCRFENIPGVEACGRCGSSLRLATAVLDVQPPRARPWVKRFRKAVPLHRASVRVRDTAQETLRQVREISADYRVPLPDRHILARLVIPGWAHHYVGQAARGNIFLAAYGVLLCLGFLLFGTTWGSILLGLAFSAHASAVLDILFQCPIQWPSRMLTTMLATMALGLGVYLPAGWLLTRFVDARVINYDAAPFADGDVVLVNQWAYLRSAPEPGDIVLYNTAQVNLQLEGGQHGYIRVVEGQGIDRIIAGPGSLVQWQNGKLLVDGQPSPFSPLSPERLPARVRSKVPEDHYLILPSTVNVRNNTNVQIPASVWQAVSAVPRSQILGRVYVRTHPLTRFWIIR